VILTPRQAHARTSAASQDAEPLSVKIRDGTARAASAGRSARDSATMPSDRPQQAAMTARL
jgi:hypothetical protein